MFRGWLSLDGIEIVNSSRVVAMLTPTTPTDDSVFGAPADCSLTVVSPGLAALAPSQQIISPGLATPPNGSRKIDPGLAVVGDCWGPPILCGGCRPFIAYDDSWNGLQGFLQDTVYRPEMAPWYSIDVGESGEFGGVWILDAKGFDPVPVSRTITELVGAGAAAGPHRDTSRTLTFTALLVACTNAGMTYGLEWLACQLRETKARTDATLRYLTAHPGGSAADPIGLLRELHGVVLTKGVSVDQLLAPRGESKQATMCQVSWEMVTLHPYAYAPMVDLVVNWDVIDMANTRWVHAADCKAPDSCDPMPVLFSQQCTPEQIDVVTTPPPTCGGCLPVCSIDTLIFEVPTLDRPLRCDETSVTLTVTNNAERSLTLQAYWRICSTDVECEDNRYPTQITDLPAGAELTLDGIAGRYWVTLEGRRRRPVGIVSTPDGLPWAPPVIDRSQCWEFVVLAPGGSDFDMVMSLADREA